MVDISIPQILVVAGDYDLIQRVDQALQEGEFAVQHAYSYRDSLYALESKNFDAVLVDGMMTDRTSGEYVIKLLDTFQAVPMVLLVRGGELPSYSQPPVQIVLGGLDKRTILRGVYSVLEVALVRGKPSLRLENSRMDEIETVFALGKSLTEVLDLSEVLNRVVAAARYLINAEEGMILLPDHNEADSPLYLRAKVGIDDEVAQNFRIKTEDTVAGRVFHTGQPQSIGAQGLQKVKTHYFVKALLYVPILLQGRPIGVLGVNNKLTDRVFDATAQDLLMNLASYAAIAIENARIHEETLQRARELQSLVEASQVLNASVSLYTTLPSICDQLSRVLNVSWTEILTWDREREQLRTLARHQKSLWREGPSIQLAKSPALQAALAERRGLQVNANDSTMPAEASELRQLGASRLLATPIMVENKLLGVLRSYFIKTPERPVTNDTFYSVQHLALQAVADVSYGNGNARRALHALENVNRIFGASWSDIGVMTN
ncbi:MAG: GAF domain-containing protein, partial [Anaerolineae bacterium]|nr:GAF domain-containing protein [Anaerolineae bacterium]